METNTTKNIRRNANKKIAAIFAQCTSAHSLTLSGSFKPEEVEIAAVQAEYIKRKDSYLGPVLRDNGDGTYTIRYHSNHWVNLS